MKSGTDLKLREYCKKNIIIIIKQKEKKTTI